MSKISTANEINKPAGAAMPKVLITDKINKSAGDILKGVAQVDFIETLSEDELAKIIGDYDGLMIRSQTKVTDKIIQAAKNMKIVGRAGVGVDNVNLDEATKAGIIVVNSPDGNTTAAAEHTVALMLAMARHIPAAAATTKEGKWERSKYTGVELFKKTLGIIGLGKIGSHVAKAALGLGMSVLVYDPFASEEIIEATGAKQVKTLDELWGVCDFITVHVPKTKDTLNLINKDTIAKMKDGVRIINCARGGIVNEQDLKEALESKKVAAAAIDVFTAEPLDNGNPLLHCDGDLILTPHLGASTEEAQINVAIDVAEQIRDVLSGLNATSAVNSPSLRAEKLEPVKEYMNIAENLGLLLGQIAKGAVKEVKIAARGTLSTLDIAPLKVAVLKGILSHSMENVNYVNAPLIAKNRGIEVSETKAEQSCSYLGLLSIKVTTEQGSYIAAGALGADGSSRIVKFNGYDTNIEPAEHILLAPHINKPGMVAGVATILGEKNVNISMMQVARKDKELNSESLMIINADSPVEDEVLHQINALDGVFNATYVHLKP
ncbi:MAG: phosphoglycerate dehydrogenase [Candidatus Gastranaerophilales bacterium]|nr:phosphoglycerate dehydrogenase [Candidatus Gastranaerophilales bacterium]